MMNHIDYRKQDGAALVVGLLLLVVITVLAISGVNTATTELAIARNDQSYENAFQGAETGLETALAQGVFLAQPAPVILPRHDIVSNKEYVDAQIQYQDPPTAVPPEAGAYSFGSGAVAHHFQVTATATFHQQASTSSDYDATATHTQAFFVIGAEPNTF